MRRGRNIFGPRIVHQSKGGCTPVIKDVPHQQELGHRCKRPRGGAKTAGAPAQVPLRVRNPEGNNFLQ